MDQETLVESQLGDARNLTERLARDGFPVTAAAWVKEADGGMWFLYLVTPLVGEDGSTRAAYSRLNTLIRAHPEPPRVHPFEIKVVGPSEAAARDMLAAQSHYPGRLVIPYRDSRLGEADIEEAYLFHPA